MFVAESMGRSAGIFAIACVCGIASGMFGIGGGVLLVPVLGLLFGFSQHRAQGTSLVALIPPTGVLALMAYAKEGFVSWRTGLLLIPGVLLGGIAGGVRKCADRIIVAVADDQRHPRAGLRYGRPGRCHACGDREND